MENKISKQRENKNKLIVDIVYDLLEQNPYDSKEYVKSLCMEALSKRTQKELKQILHGE